MKTVNNRNPKEAVVPSKNINMENSKIHGATTHMLDGSDGATFATGRDLRVEPSEKKRSLNILTVGDGDFSCSLALVRAYPNHISHLVATTLLQNEEELNRTYPSSAMSILQELKHFDACDEKLKITLLYGVDATKLHLDSRLTAHFGFSDRKDTDKELDGDYISLDLFLFHFPHLGVEDATLHSCLLAHYLESAMKLLQQPSSSSGCMEVQLPHQLTIPRVHLCLTNSAAIHWKLNDVAQQVGLEFHPPPISTSRPLLSHWMDDANRVDVTRAAITSPISQVNLKSGGSRKGHWLGRFGYRHQPTDPKTTKFSTNTTNSTHFFLRPMTPTLDTKSNISSTEVACDLPGRRYCCRVCQLSFISSEELRRHVLSPVPLPDSESHAPEQSMLDSTATNTSSVVTR